MGLFCGRKKGRRKNYVGQRSVVDAAFAADGGVDGLFTLGNRTDFPGRRPTVRLYIEAESGVTVDDCAQVSHQVSGILDVEDPISGEYTLEVSSPGVDRLLFHPEQYPPYIGEIVDVRLRLPVDGRRRFKGNLAAAEKETIVIEVDDQPYELPLRSVDRARAHPQRL